jgi:glucose-1-phosphate thymidylyltransferase
MNTLGIILAAGTSSRLFPATMATTKQLLPIYDKPLIYYPLSTLMLAGIKDILIITSPDEKTTFEKLFHRSDVRLGINLNFTTQEQPLGIADAFKLANKFYGEKVKEYDNVALILGDNIFYGSTLTGSLVSAKKTKDLATVFAQRVVDPERFGVVVVENNRPVEIVEKPKNPKSNLAVTGLYFYPSDVFDKVDKLQPSARNELEITDLNNVYLKENRLNVEIMRRGISWFDTGTADSMIEASHFVQTIQKNQGILVNSPHEIAFRYDWIDAGELRAIAQICGKTQYGKFLLELLENHYEYFTGW